MEEMIDKYFRSGEALSDLEAFRERSQEEPMCYQDRRLQYYPFSHADILFGTRYIPDKNRTKLTKYFDIARQITPCAVFGRHLVLKIVDELLDFERRETRKEILFRDFDDSNPYKYESFARCFSRGFKWLEKE